MCLSSYSIEFFFSVTWQGAPGAQWQALASLQTLTDACGVIRDSWYVIIELFPNLPNVLHTFFRQRVALDHGLALSGRWGIGCQKHVLNGIVTADSEGPNFIERLPTTDRDRKNQINVSVRTPLYPSFLKL